jgi:hypothetical protein
MVAARRMRRPGAVSGRTSTEAGEGDSGSNVVTWPDPHGADGRPLQGKSKKSGVATPSGRLSAERVVLRGPDVVRRQSRGTAGAAGLLGRIGRRT